jgi:predicted nucleotidyltransferase
MPVAGLNISEKIKKKMGDFASGLEQLYAQDLISVILYGSAASGEYTAGHSNLNLLVVLKDAGLAKLKPAIKLIARFALFEPLFLSESYIASSTDVFPIEFLDLQENYRVIFGKDILSGLTIETKNLRFQCEQELKGKLLNLKQAYLRLSGNKAAASSLLFRAFTSALHILRNALRLKGIKPPYPKDEVLKKLNQEFGIDLSVWGKILAAKSRKIRLGSKETADLFVAWVQKLERIAGIVDKL